MEVGGRVVRLLEDDEEDAGHQRFVIRIGSGQTVLIAHNLGAASRVPLGMGDRVRVRGLFEWSRVGGLIHWTHHDPRGELDGGWVEFRRRRYC